MMVLWWWQDLHSPFNILSLVQQWITNKQLKVKEKEMFKSLQVAISWWGSAVVVGGGEIFTKPPWESQFLIIFVTAALNMDFLTVSYSLPSALPSIEEEFLPLGTKAPQLSQFLLIFTRSPKVGPCWLLHILYFLAHSKSLDTWQMLRRRLNNIIITIKTFSMLKQLINIKMKLWDVLWRKDKGALCGRRKTG